MQQQLHRTDTNDQSEREHRLPADIKVEIRNPAGEGKGAGRVRNLNPNGLLVEQELLDVDRGDSIGVEFPATGTRGRVMILGEVAWKEGEQTGVRVNGMMPHHRARFERMVSSIATSQTLLG
jgi:hypothetical protein